MGRGFIYEISSDIGNVGHMSESDFYDFSSYIADYVKDVEDDEELIQKLLKRLQFYGAETGYLVDSEGVTHPYFRMAKSARKAYFYSQFSRFQQIAEEMTLEAFSENVFGLLDAIECKYGDAMYLDGVYYDSFDDGIRNLSTDTKYYIGNVVLMH